ncbi:hypothetical protein ACFWN2_04635 [Lentzea sp. NPDC058436]|uniref:hypothetical protein n=1 Tax=Lentzea sp. NPDC058436 TaxID=3346499 RepID=UPI00364F1109
MARRHAEARCDGIAEAVVISLIGLTDLATSRSRLPTAGLLAAGRRTRVQAP